jgi:hypothetical protein
MPRCEESTKRLPGTTNNEKEKKNIMFGKYKFKNARNKPQLKPRAACCGLTVKHNIK